MDYAEASEIRSFSFLAWFVGLAMCVVLIGLFLTSAIESEDKNSH
jgi:hypothetical protein